MREATRRLSVDAGTVFATENELNYNNEPGTKQCVAIGMLADPAVLGMSPTYWVPLPSWQRQLPESSIKMRIERAGKQLGELRANRSPSAAKLCGGLAVRM